MKLGGSPLSSIYNPACGLNTSILYHRERKNEGLERKRPSCRGVQKEVIKFVRHFRRHFRRHRPTVSNISIITPFEGPLSPKSRQQSRVRASFSTSTALPQSLMPSTTPLAVPKASRRVMEGHELDPRDATGWSQVGTRLEFPRPLPRIGQCSVSGFMDCICVGFICRQDLHMVLCLN